MTVAREQQVEPSQSRGHVTALCNFLVTLVWKVMRVAWVEVLTIAPSPRFTLIAGSGSEIAPRTR